MKKSYLLILLIGIFVFVSDAFLFKENIVQETQGLSIENSSRHDMKIVKIEHDGIEEKNIISQVNVSENIMNSSLLIDQNSKEAELEQYLVYTEENIGSTQTHDNMQRPEPNDLNMTQSSTGEYADQINQDTIIKTAVDVGYLVESDSSKAKTGHPEPTRKNAIMQPKETFFSEIDQNEIMKKSELEGNITPIKVENSPSKNNSNLLLDDEYSNEINVSL